MKTLFIGGTGVISSACSKLAIAKGIDLYHLNRGQSSSLRPIEGVKNIVANIRDVEATRKVLENYSFDVVVDWISFTPEHIQNSIDLFSGKTDQFVFISSASAYQTPPEALPVTEDTPLSNPFWQYSRDKMACEDVLKDAFKKTQFPYTIIRPSHTYDKTLIPLIGGYTAYQRLKQGKPVIVHGDGTSLWTLTHHTDFAIGLVGLFGKKLAINNAYQITSDEWLSWNQIYGLIAKELGVKPNIVHVPSEVIAKYDQELGDGLLGDKSHSMIFDNSKIKALVPEFNAKISFNDGVKEIVAWYEAHPSPNKFDSELDKTMDEIIQEYSR